MRTSPRNKYRARVIGRVAEALTRLARALCTRLLAVEGHPERWTLAPDLSAQVNTRPQKIVTHEHRTQRKVCVCVVLFVREPRNRPAEAAAPLVVNHQRVKHARERRTPSEPTDER
jgi:hypothetical protein